MKRSYGILGILAFLMLVSSAAACHYWCFGAQTDPTEANANLKVLHGQILTFTGSDAAATYTWVVRDDAGTQVGSSFTGSPFVWTVPVSTSVVYTVEWTASVTYTNSLTCIKTGCIKIFIKTLPQCPSVPDYCYGLTPATVPTVTLPTTTPALTGITYAWDIDGTVIGGNTNPVVYGGWNTVNPGPHTLSFSATMTVGGITSTIMSCSPGMPFTVKPAVTGGVSIS